MQSDIFPGKRFPRLVGSSRAGATAGNTVDATLIARIAAHDRAAMQTLYIRHHSRIRRFILRFAPDDTVADELVHQVFLDVWRRAGRFAGHSPASVWLLAIARHEAIQAAGARSRSLDTQRDMARPAP
jgi:RNA polymerase sigma-70 factor, ECF subfamily